MASRFQRNIVLAVRRVGSATDAEATADRSEACHELANRTQTLGPVVVEAVVDPNEPPMPAKVKAKQALHFAESLARGTPDRSKIIADVVEDRISELI